MDSLRARVYEFYKKYNFRASPVLDQFFLVDSAVIERAVRYAELSEQDTVLEIGPGIGFLTKEIAKHAGKVIAVEKDKKLDHPLHEEFKDYSNVEIIIGDFLKIKVPEFNKVVSNIPYSLSSEITFKLLDYDFEKAILFYQKEFGEKMMAKPGARNYGRLSVMVQYYYDVELKEIVKREKFYPQPKTDSVIMVLKKKKMDKNPDFDKFVRELFRYKNKKVRNAVEIAFKKNIEDDRKVDSLSIPEVVELYERVKRI